MQWNDQHGIAGVADQRGYAPYREESEDEGHHGNHALQPLFGCEQLNEHTDGDAYDGKLLQQGGWHIHQPADYTSRGANVGFHAGRGAVQIHGEQDYAYAEHQREERVRQIGEIAAALRWHIVDMRLGLISFGGVRHC